MEKAGASYNYFIIRQKLERVKGIEPLVIIPKTNSSLIQIIWALIMGKIHD
jgi:hypothetical protein